MKVAVIGSGIAGMSCAHYLHRECDVHLFEAESRLGGHTATVDVVLGGRRYAVDTGFIVYNDRTYPNFIALMQKLGVVTKKTQMSFSLSDLDSGIEYAGSNVNTLFAQRRNLVSPTFLGMLKDILRFNRDSVRHLAEGVVDSNTTLGEYLHHFRYGEAFKEYYLIPMGSAIWSADTPYMLAFPLQFFVRFFSNHGLLNIMQRPQWRVIEGGSREYIEPLCAGYRDKVRLHTAVRGVRRLENSVEILLGDNVVERFDHLVFACHSDQALAILLDASQVERDILGAIPYQSNDVVLHTDASLLPRSRRAWSSWNYHRSGSKQRATLTYNMNILQGIEAPETFCVTLNNTEVIDPHRILGRFTYDHPVFTLASTRAQNRWGEINGGRTWFCGSYWRNGFHEDGVVSALRVARALKSSGTGGRVSDGGMGSAA